MIATPCSSLQRLSAASPGAWWSVSRFHALPYVEAGDSRLIAVRGELDQGALERGSTKTFEWVESPARWADVAGLVVTLRRPSEIGHQYLAPSLFGGGRGIVVELSVGEHWAL